MPELLLTVPQENDGERLDKLIALLAEDISRSAAQQLIEKGLVLSDGCALVKNHRVHAGQTICIALPEPEPIDAVAQDIPLEIVYEDDELLVVNKPKGMVVHPAPGNPDGTLVNALLWHCGGSLSGINGSLRPGIVHRIDKKTSGLLIVAKTDRAHSSLAAQIEAHSFTREYEAVVRGTFGLPSGSVNAPIGRSTADRKKMCVTQKNSRHAVTHYTVLEQSAKLSYLRLRLETGRTHQIRVHMNYIGHPVYGDEVYGKPAADIDGQCLHARAIGFVHPVTNEYMEFRSELPEYFADILKKYFTRLVTDKKD